MSAIFTGCNQDDDITPDPTNTDGLTLIASGYTDAGSMMVKVWSTDSLYSRYTSLLIEVRDSATDAVIENADVTLMPMMQMQSGMTHSAPYEDPTSTNAIDGLFPCAVVFQMPGDMGWTLKVMVHENVNGGMGEVTFPLMVKNPTPTRTHVVTPANGGNKLVISYVQPLDPKVGINDFEIALHSKESMMDWPAIENYTIEIEPEMPSMGHGSPNNVDPTHGADGHYNGQVNFTMTGLWNINLRIMDGTTVVDSTAFFEVTLQ